MYGGGYEHEMFEASPNLISGFHVLVQINAHEM